MDAEAGCTIISLLIAAAITAILALAKVGIPLAMGWVWVFAPLIVWAVLFCGIFVLGDLDF